MEVIHELLSLGQNIYTLNFTQLLHQLIAFTNADQDINCSNAYLKTMLPNPLLHLRKRVLCQDLVTE